MMSNLFMRFSFFKKPETVVIGIHGLFNKPPKYLLRRWWITAIREGFERAGLHHHPFAFELVYWAHHAYSRPLDIRERREGHPQFVDEPYIPSSKTTVTLKMKYLTLLIRPIMRKALDMLFFTSEAPRKSTAIVDNIVAQTLPDLVRYYENKRVFSRRKGIRDILRSELRSVLKRYSGSRILIISHSMGSIIAFDVLSDDRLDIDTFVTVGSPLGLPYVRREFARERRLSISKKKTIHSPKSVRNAWYNLADPKDMVAFNAHITGNYSKNRRGVAPQDISVRNDYICNKHENHHNICGYLRTPEMVRIIHDFFTR
jgi:hypothetical protein